MKKQTILKVTSGVLSGILVLTGASQLGKIEIQAKEKIEVEVNKDIQITIREDKGGAVVELVATKDISNADVKITIDGTKVITYHIDSLRARQKDKKVITKEQLEKIRDKENNKKILPNTAVVRKNLEKAMESEGRKIKVQVAYDVEENEVMPNKPKKGNKQGEEVQPQNPNDKGSGKVEKRPKDNQDGKIQPQQPGNKGNDNPTLPNKPTPPMEQPNNPENNNQDEEVIVSDPLLKKLINKNIDPSRADNQKITKKEIESLKTIKLRDKADKPILESTSLKGTPDFKFIQTRGIKNISGLEKAINLEYLELGENEITDLTPLTNLNNLKHLSLFRNRITNVEPLANLTNLEYLDLYANKLTDISALKDLVNLKHLDLHNNNDQTGDETHPTISGGISDISVVANMPKLEMLSIGSNNVSDISAIAGLKNIKELVLGGNHISDYSKVIDYIVPRILKMINEEGGSIKFDGQRINYGKEVEVTSKNVSISNPFKGINEIGNKLAKALESEETINFFANVKTNVDGVSAIYNPQTSNFDFSFTDKFLEKNNGKEISVNLKLGFEEYAWSINNIKLKINKKEENKIDENKELRNNLEALIKRDIRSEEGYIPNAGNQPANNNWINVRTKAEQVLANKDATKEQLEEAIASLKEATYNALLGSEKVKARNVLTSLGKLELIPQITKATTIEKVKEIVANAKGITEDKPSKPETPDNKEGDTDKPAQPNEPTPPKENPSQPNDKPTLPDLQQQKPVITDYSIDNKVLESTGGTVKVTIKGKNLTDKNVKIKVLNPLTATKDNVLSDKFSYEKVGDDIIATITLPENKDSEAKSFNLTFTDGNGLKATTTYEEARGENGRVITVLPAGKNKQDSVLSFVTISSYQAHRSTDLTTTTTDKGNVSKKTVAHLYGTNLKANVTKVKIIDQNGVEWPIHTTGGTVAASDYPMMVIGKLGNGISGNGTYQEAEIVLPNGLDSDMTFTYIFAPDGVNFDESHKVTAVVEKTSNVKSAQKRTITVKYQDEQGKKLKDDKKLTGYSWFEYNIEKENVEGYKNITVKDSKALSGTFGTSDQEITLVYTNNEVAVPSENEKTATKPAEDTLETSKEKLQKLVDKDLKNEQSYKDATAELQSNWRRAKAKAQQLLANNGTKEEIDAQIETLQKAIEKVKTALK
ncbi:leucine-rich repeat domain-containing protein [Gemella cuniculi]|uniref:leucine-rich repeat domain-containing protein n=1 Tax=Gemella cuniculi TaxID=150240 RepID=UPI00040023C0|nr:leucine-rich repeat domain-containing protein [Gemella cuniculi]